MKKRALYINIMRGMACNMPEMLFHAIVNFVAS